MNIAETPPTERRRQALEAVRDLGKQRTDHALLKVKCPASHMVAAVYDTSAGHVVVCGTGPGGHGSRDRNANNRGGDSLDDKFVDTVEATQFEDDELPAGCGCGPRTISRKKLQDAVVSHAHVVTLT
ncbi:MAG: hypothetical protein GXY65_16400 [Rhodococcus sp.]|uniref:hypothetical protein n=1 Tax=Rhodococcus TaxID=1827 RepID=UPI0016A0F16A|nr:MULTISPECIES: hypothetical protein [Rhodococcus]NLV80886.1 hypothetical protein [Rhodococcus sp. (in: high G+C Gram-positive bacteria)]